VLGSAALLGGALLSGCSRRAHLRRPVASSPAVAARLESGSPSRLPLVEVQGAPRELGRGAGQQLAGVFRDVLAGRAGWWRDLKSFADARPPLRAKFLAAAAEHTPAALEELRGWAEGYGVAFEDLLTFNLQAEYGALRNAERRKQGEQQPGCSTVVLRDSQRLILAHNEDGDRAYLDRMFLLRARPTTGPGFLAACYPGILPGNAPWANERGLISTTNFIATQEVRAGGIGRYFLHRAALGAGSVAEAIRASTPAERAYSFHSIFASASERRAVSLEVTPDRTSEEDAAGLYLHTNHLVHEAMREVPQDSDYVGLSSTSRYRVLSDWKSSVEDLAVLTDAELAGALSSHVARPHSPCRHPEAEVRGATVLCAIFDVPARRLRLYRGQPCARRSETYAV